MYSLHTESNLSESLRVLKIDTIVMNHDAGQVPANAQTPKILKI